jgi:hypothetical protein
MSFSRRVFIGAAAAGIASQARADHPHKIKIPSGQSYGTNFDPSAWAYTEPAPGVQRFEIRSGDQGWGGDPRGIRHRSEISSNEHVPFGAPVWQAWSQLIEFGPRTREGFLICNQWHNTDTTKARSPCLQFGYANERLTIDTNSDDLINPSGNPHTLSQYDGPAPSRGVWHAFVARYVFGPPGTGELALWINGSPLIKKRIPLGTWHDSVGPYNKYGIYCADGSAMVSPFAINYANMRVGIDPQLQNLIANPEPVPTWAWGYRS